LSTVITHREIPALVFLGEKNLAPGTLVTGRAGSHKVLWIVRAALGFRMNVIDGGGKRSAVETLLFRDGQNLCLGSFRDPHDSP
jgi:hypothetical protein